MATMKQTTPEEKREAFAAADRYFDEMEAGVLTPESLKGVARKRNPLFGIFYADGYLEGRDARMTPTETAVIEAARTFVLRVREYNALIDTANWSSVSDECIAAANAMEAAEDALVDAAQPLIE